MSDKSNQPANSNAAGTAAGVIVVLLVLAGLGVGGFFVARKFFYSKGKPQREKKPKRRKFQGLKNVETEEIETLTSSELDGEDMQEDDDPMGTLLSQ